MKNSLKDSIPFLYKIVSGVSRVPRHLKIEFQEQNALVNVKFQIGICIFFILEYLLSSLIFYLILDTNLNSHIHLGISVQHVYIIAFFPLFIVLALAIASFHFNFFKNKQTAINRLNTIIILLSASTTSILVGKTFIYQLAFLLVSLLFINPPKFYIPVYIVNFVYMTSGFYFYKNSWDTSEIEMTANTISITILCFVISRLRLTDKIDNFLINEKMTQQNIILNKQNKKLQAMTRIDGLTKIKNRRAFDEALNKEWSRARRYKQSLGLLMIDIDFFKKYNDTYGHLKGDTCLKLVAAAINKNTKRSADIAARYGGEEFAVILTDISENSLAQFAEKLRIEIQNLCIEHTKNKCGYVTISIGGACLTPSHKNSASELIKQADQSLYMAKDTGRNKVVIHT